MKVKMFTNQGDAPKLESEVNQWLSEHNIKISHSHIEQSYAYDSKGDVFYTLIYIWYDELI